MSSDQKQKSNVTPNWGSAYDSQALSPKRAASLAALIAAIISMPTIFSNATVLEAKLPRTVEFKVREAFGLGPKFSPRLKVFAFEDAAAARFGYTDLTLQEWADVIERIAARKPARILLDKTFAHPLGSNEATAFSARIAALGVPVIAKAHVTEVRLPDLEPLKVTTPPPSSWVPRQEFFAYGSRSGAGAGFTTIGHNAGFDQGQARAVVRTRDGAALTHWTMLAATDLSFTDDGVVVAGQLMPTDAKGTFNVNLLSFEASRSHLRSLTSLMPIAESTAEPPGLASIAPGDVVLILTDMHTGSVDYEETALGRLPSGFMEMAVANSMLTGDFVRVTGGRLPLTFLMAFAGAWLTRLTCSRRGTIGYAIGLSTVFEILALTSFVKFNIALPWVAPTMAFLATALVASFETLRMGERRSALLRHDLMGVLPTKILNKLAESRNLESLEAREQVVTMMFIDIVGFSRAAETMAPKEAFASLQKLLGALREAVYEHGGRVDRTMGDGMLCLFGGEFGEQQSSGGEHAAQAVACATKMQRDNLERILKASKSGAAVFPIRIGINTASVFLGNLGDTEKLDYTVIGGGVNLAQRLEAACDRHMVMLGASTRDLIIQDPHVVRMVRQRHIRIKHSDDLLEAYELDPFVDEPQVLVEVEEAYRIFIGVERTDTRHPVPDIGMIKIMTSHGDGDLLNFSQDGFTISLPKYYGQGVTMTMQMDTLNGELSDRLESQSLVPIVLEVRWARPGRGGFMHGCLIKNMTVEQRHEIVRHLRDIISHIAGDRPQRSA